MQDYLNQADVVLVVGSELSEVDSFAAPLEINGKIIRIDLDARKMHDLYPVEVAIIGGARASCAAILRELEDIEPRSASADEVAEIRRRIGDNLEGSESRHRRVLEVLRASLPAATRVMADVCQLSYSGAFAFDVPVMVAAAVACLPVFLTGHRIARWEGFLFVGYYGAYVAYLVLDAARLPVHDGRGIELEHAGGLAGHGDERVPGIRDRDDPFGPSRVGLVDRTPARSGTPGRPWPATSRGGAGRFARSRGFASQRAPGQR